MVQLETQKIILSRLYDSERTSAKSFKKKMTDLGIQIQVSEMFDCHVEQVDEDTVWAEVTSRESDYRFLRDFSKEILKKFGIGKEGDFFTYTVYHNFNDLPAYDIDVSDVLDIDELKDEHEI